MTLSATVFLVVAAVLGGVPSAWGVLAIPAAVLGALAFAAPLAAFAVTQESDLPFPLIMRLGVLPLFLFSGTFFPVAPAARLAAAARRSSRRCGTASSCAGWRRPARFDGAEAVGNVLVLVACFIGAGWLWGVRTFNRKLTQ